jgi:hypothetical protein
VCKPLEGEASGTENVGTWGVPPGGQNRLTDRAASPNVGRSEVWTDRARGREEGVAWEVPLVLHSRWQWLRWKAALRAHFQSQVVSGTRLPPGGGLLYFPTDAVFAYVRALTAASRSLQADGPDVFRAPERLHLDGAFREYRYNDAFGDGGCWRRHSYQALLKGVETSVSRPQLCGEVGR